MAEEVQTVTPASKKLTKEERSLIAKEAAKRRWAKAAKAAKSKASKRSKLPKHKSASRREFSSALKTAEKQLAKCLHDRDEAATRYALANAQIPSLMRIINALKSPGGNGIGDTLYAAQDISIEKIVSGQPLGYANPSRLTPPIPAPPAQHPANAMGRAQGGAVAVELVEEDDENKFLRESPAAGGEWH